jgi:hypothetical protein
MILPWKIQALPRIFGGCSEAGVSGTVSTARHHRCIGRRKRAFAVQIIATKARLITPTEFRPLETGIWVCSWKRGAKCTNPCRLLHVSLNLRKIPSGGKSILKLGPDWPGRNLTGKTENNAPLSGNIGKRVTTGNTGSCRSIARYF